MSAEPHKWESDHIKNKDIEYGLFFKDKLMFKSNSKPEIMVKAESYGFLKSSYKDPFEFVTAPHLKENVMIKMRPLQAIWRVVGEVEDKGIKCMELITSEGF
jgi:hypothetical protein